MALGGVEADEVDVEAERYHVHIVPLHHPPFLFPSDLPAPIIPPASRPGGGGSAAHPLSPKNVTSARF